MIAKKFLMLNAAMALFACFQAEAATWPETVSLARQAVVTIRIDQVRAFDDEWNKSSEATGFVVDAKRGLILTNRHVVTPAPVSARAEFTTGEEAQLTAVYRDPVHDFGFFRFDPDALDYTEPKALVLAPDKAEVGLDIRIVGNDAGERFQVLSGTIARLDRNAPSYKTVGYNDFNTFYIQAATGSSGGSSGSPVLDIEGRVVALNAGAGSGTQSSFFLPLDRVAVALAQIQLGMAPERGTLLTTFGYTPFAELVHLGLPQSELDKARKVDPDGIGMLQITRVMPDSPASEALSVGDIVLSVNGAGVTRFAALEELLDRSVGREVRFELQRGNERIERQVEVSDLHAVTPASLLELGNAVLHTLSYQLARGVDKRATGVLVASPGFTLSRAGLDKGSVLTELNGKPINKLEPFVEFIEALPDGVDMRLRYYNVDNPGLDRFTVVKLDRRWLATRYCERPTVGDWFCRALANPPDGDPPPPRPLPFGPYPQEALDFVAPELVNVIFEPPVGMQGLDESIRRGVGLVVDWNKGMVAVDRSLVPHGVGRVSLIFDGRLELDASVVFVHPLHALTLLKFDPGAIAHPIARSVTLRDEASAGERVWFVDRDNAYRASASVTELGPVRLIEEGPSSSLAFRETNLEAISLPPNVPPQGVVADVSGRVLGLVSSNEGAPGRYLLPPRLIRSSLAHYEAGTGVPTLGLELSPLPLANARRLGLSEAWLERLATADGGRPQALVILQIRPMGPLDGIAQPGDLLLAIEGKPVVDFSDVEAALADATNGEPIEVTLWQGELDSTIRLRPERLSGVADARYVTWAGALFHAPHRAAVFAGVNESAPYVPFYYYGSPASRAGLRPLYSVMAIDDQTIHHLDDLVRHIATLSPGQWVRLRAKGWRGDEQVIALQHDPKYWPGLEVRSRPEGEATVVTQATIE